MQRYDIRPLTEAEVQHGVDWAGREGWNPGVDDAECFRPTYPSGFLGGFLDGEMISSVSAVNYDDSFSFLGFYIVKPEFRHHSHGIEIAQHALSHCTGRNMGLDGVVEQQDNYRKSGFSFAYNNYRFAGTKHRILAKLEAEPNSHISDLKQASDELNVYDRALFPAPRDLILENWLGAIIHVSKLYPENGRTRDYATLRPCLTGYKIAPYLRTLQKSRGRCWPLFSRRFPRIITRTKCSWICHSPMYRRSRWPKSLGWRRSLRPRGCIPTTNPRLT